MHSRYIILQKQAINVAEHALGLTHNEDTKKSVMYQYNNLYPIQKVDIAGIKKFIQVNSLKIHE